MSLKDAYLECMDAQLWEEHVKIQQLKAKADHATVAKVYYYEQIEVLRTKQAAVQQKLLELKSSGENTWEHLKAGVDGAWNDLKRAYDDAIAKFK
jgi:predicted ATPase